MLKATRPWHEELAIIDGAMKAISGVTDPQELVRTYWDAVAELMPSDEYLALSRRGVEAPFFLITRSSRFTEHPNPWTERDRLPRLSGGLLGEIAYAERPVIIDDLPARLERDDPAWFYLEGFQSLVALPQYDGGVALNIAVTLLAPGVEFDHSTIPLMHWQTGLFGRGAQNLVLRNQLSEAHGALDRELQVVGEIQRSLLPRESPAIDGVEMAAHYVTSARAGGDYYDFFPLGPDKWGLFIADVSGHGAPAAVLMAVTHALAHSRPGAHAPPDALLTYLNAQLARSYTRLGTFVTAFYAVLDARSRTLTYSAAGHNPPRLARAGRILSLDEAGALPLGVFGAQVYSQASIELAKGDLLLLYTDGITEAMAPRRSGEPPDLFGVSRLDRALLDGGSCAAGACIERIRAEVGEFTRGAPPADDQTLIVLRCAG